MASLGWAVLSAAQDYTRNEEPAPTSVEELSGPIVLAFPDAAPKRTPLLPGAKKALSRFPAFISDTLLNVNLRTNLAIRRPEFTEVIVGPIGQTTFGQTVAGILADLGIPEDLLPIFLELFAGVVDLGNGAGSILGSAPDAFSYAVVDVTEGANGPQLTLTARGNPDYLAGANDPADVVDLFTVQMP